jgi:transglutaminase-like putative cysteine protease
MARPGPDEVLPMNAYLSPSAIVDFDHPAVAALARELAAADPLATARLCYLWVRDEVRHSIDAGLTAVPCAASEVLAERSGFCYAKSHLLAALLRANGIPTGFCYQRLSLGAEAGFSLHGLNAVRLPFYGWYRVDPRGNKRGIDADFTPPHESLAYAVRHRGEADLPEIWPAPLSRVVAALRSAASAAEVAASLPDIPLLG